ncbi:MAG: hypothetical protein H7122_17470 [Chitinophagaceae bacterium]|nr:hypothetical protein [Chitinophagaceae bacterium]
MIGYKPSPQFYQCSLQCAAVMFGAAAILDKYPDPPDWIKIVLFFGIWVVYEPLCTSCGCTIGNYVKGIRVRKHSNLYQRINILQAFVRYATKAY